MNDAYKQCLGAVLTEKRHAAKINKRQLSLMLDISRPTLRMIESGDANPTIDMLLRITQGVGVSLADVIRECERRMAELPESARGNHYILSEE